MLWRIAARLLTGPAAFLVGGLLDVGALALAWRRGHAGGRERMDRRDASGG